MISRRIWFTLAAMVGVLVLLGVAAAFGGYSESITALADQILASQPQFDNKQLSRSKISLNPSVLKADIDNHEDNVVAGQPSSYVAKITLQKVTLNNVNILVGIRSLRNIGCLGLQCPKPFNQILYQVKFKTMTPQQWSKTFPVTIPANLTGQKVQAYIFVLGSQAAAKSPSIYTLAQDTDLVVSQQPKPSPVPPLLQPKEGRAPQIIEISPKRVGAQIFAHVKTDQGAAIILSSLSRCQGEACFGWQAMIVPPTDPSQLVTQIDLPILDLDTTAVPSDIRLTVTTIDLAKRTANFSYRYDPATNTLTPLNQAVF